MRHESRPAIQMEKQLGWAYKPGEAQSLGISMASQTLLASLIESQIEYHLAGSVAGEKGLEKGQWPLLTLMPDTSVSPCMPLVPFKLLPQWWSSERVSLSR